MDDIGGVHVEEPAEELVDKVLDVVFREVLAGVDYSVEIGLHELGDDVDVGVASFVFGAQQVHHVDDVLVLEEFWVICCVLSSLISRTMRLASIRSSKALMTYVGRTVPS